MLPARDTQLLKYVTLVPPNQQVADDGRNDVQENSAQSWRAVVTEPGCTTCHSGSTTSGLQMMACTMMSPPGFTGGLCVYLSTPAVRDHPHLCRGPSQQASTPVSAWLKSVVMLEMFASCWQHLRKTDFASLDPLTQAMPRLPTPCCLCRFCCVLVSQLCKQPFCDCCTGAGMPTLGTLAAWWMTAG